MRNFRLKTIILFAAFLAFASMVLRTGTAQASSGSFSVNVTYSKASIAWNFLDASTVSLYQGEWAMLQFNSTWNFWSGCWPGADQPTCSPPAPAGQANTTVIWKQDTCPAGANCYWYEREASNPLQLTWGIVSNYQYTNTVMISNTQNLAPGTYPMTFSAEEHPTACQQSGGTCIPKKTFTVYLKILGPAPKALISAYPATINFAGFSGGGTPASNSVTLKNTGSAQLNWTASTNQSWCHASPASGSLAPGSTIPLTVSVDAPSNTGTFNCAVTFTDPNAGNSPQTVSVIYSVTSSVPAASSGGPGSPAITSISPSQFTLSQVQNQATMDVYGSQFSTQLTCNLPVYTRVADGQQTGIAAVGFIPGGLRIWVPANLIVGSYTIQILNCADFVNLRSNPVSFNVVADQPTTISLNPSGLAFTGISGGSAPTGKSVTLKNAGAGAMNWTATTDQSWCHISSLSGFLAPGATANIAVSVDPPSNIGNFTCHISFSAPNAANSPQMLTATYQVSSSATATISLSAASLSYYGVSGGSTPSGQNLAIRNAGTGTLNWTASKNQNWCNISPSSGSLVAGASVTTFVTVGAPSNVGTFNCTVTISAPSTTNSPQAINISYTVAGTPKPAFLVSPASYAFQAVSGGVTPSAQVMTIKNTGSATMNWYAGTNQNWCHISPAKGTLSAGSFGEASVAVDAPSNVGTFSCTITIFDPNATNNPQNVAVSYQVITGSIGSPSKFSAVAAGCNVIALTWKAATGAASYALYRNTENSMPAVPLVASINGTSYGDSSVTAGTSYYYWVAGNGGGAAVAANTNGSGGVSAGACQADLSASDKNLRAVNDVLQPNSDCDHNQFQGAPKDSTLTNGDKLTFEINVCNLAGLSDAKNVIVTDKLTNLDQPQEGFRAAVNGAPLTYVSGSPNAAGEYSFVPGTNLVTFNLGSIPKGAAKQVTYDVVIKTQVNQASGCVRCQNQASISYQRDSKGDAQIIDLYTPPIFYSGNKNY